MATHPGDRTPEKPVAPVERDKRWPLSEVAFTSPTKIPGSNVMFTTLEAGIMRLVDGKEWHPGPMWFDPETRVVQVEGACYPLERVHYFKRAKMAITKKPPGLDLERYTLTARPPRKK